MEYQCTDSSEKKGYGYIETSKERYKYGGSEHGKKMLNSKYQHAWPAQLTGVVDGILWFHK